MHPVSKSADEVKGGQKTSKLDDNIIGQIIL